MREEKLFPTNLSPQQPAKIPVEQYERLNMPLESLCRWRHPTLNGKSWNYLGNVSPCPRVYYIFWVQSNSTVSKILISGNFTPACFTFKAFEVLFVILQQQLFASEKEVASQAHYSWEVLLFSVSVNHALSVKWRIGLLSPSKSVGGCFIAHG